MTTTINRMIVCKHRRKPLCIVKPNLTRFLCLFTLFQITSANITWAYIDSSPSGSVKHDNSNDPVTLVTTESDSLTVHNNHHTPSTSNTIVINGGHITGTSSISTLSMSTLPSSSSSSLPSFSNSAIDELSLVNTTDALLALLYPSELSSPSIIHNPVSLSYASATSPSPSTNSTTTQVSTLNVTSTSSSSTAANSPQSSSSFSPSTSTIVPPATSTSADSLQGAASEHRLRWIDYRNRPAYPPRVPPVPGIPSGFRNPVTPTYLSASGSSIPQSPLYHNPPFGGSSTNPVGFAGSIPSSPSSSASSTASASSSGSFLSTNGNGMSRKPSYNLTRVEHISAECSDDYMKVVTVFNGTFTGLVYSAGYVHDTNCIYVNGTGRNRYDFFIRLNQCGTLGRQEMYHPKRPGELRRRDQVMWNTLSIQYNPLIEEEFDEHYRVTCEYGSDFWKTVTFPSIGVEVNTGSPVVFTINPPQCQMEIRRGFSIAGPRTSGPVTVGDPLTLLIHMKSEKAGFDILVKNCIAHNGANQRLQLIDTNGCVTNEKLISPFRGTYNTDDGHQVTLYAYLKAFRFTGSPALYLECDIHMCHNKCPPQRCYWRNLSKRDLTSVSMKKSSPSDNPLISESISLFQALEVRHDDEPQDAVSREARNLGSLVDMEDGVCFRMQRIAVFLVTLAILFITTIFISVCSCLKLRQLKKETRCVNYPSSPYKSSKRSCSSSMGSNSMLHSPYKPHSTRY
ncbi:uncharacterized protein LOC107371721 isoform X2 [Tetranychus urticae]|uniref:ZP domain-containing protein n=1 Tax=Tetranychus urticae TaxID=32264 RepID=T1JWI0_TETUR|nr:uncharacterized protein LOC107371721 isoform X2 [Tetranychus urticae]